MTRSAKRRSRHITTRAFHCAHPRQPDKQTQPNLASLLGISASPSLHLRLVLLVTLQVNVDRSSDGAYVNPADFEFAQTFGGSRPGPIDAEHFDTMAR